MGVALGHWVLQLTVPDEEGGREGGWEGGSEPFIHVKGAKIASHDMYM